MNRIEHREEKWIFPFVEYSCDTKCEKLPLVVQLHGAGRVESIVKFIEQLITGYNVDEKGIIGMAIKQKKVQVDFIDSLYAIRQLNLRLNCWKNNIT